MDHQFQFDKNRKRVELCPCGKSNKDGKFSPFKGYLDKGHCHSCDKNFFPDKNKDDNPFKSNHHHVYKPNQEIKPTFIDLNLFKKSLSSFNCNYFITYLRSVFRTDLVDCAVEKYKIGTSKLWKGATVFWQIDELGFVRTGKIMLYDDLTGKRVKKPIDHINWVHSVLKIPDYKLVQVLFGSHLLKSSHNTVAIVESEKTAIIASICFPDVTWLAAGSKDGLKIEKFKPLKNRNIILYPDANAYELWSTFAEKNSADFKIKVSKLIDITLTAYEKSSGDDIADFLLANIPEDLKAEHQTAIPDLEINTGKVSTPDIFNNFKTKNPYFTDLIRCLALEPDPYPTSNNNWSNDIPATIKKLSEILQPNIMYKNDEIKELISKHHVACTIQYDLIIKKLLDAKVIAVYPFYSDTFFKVGSTPF